MPNLWESIQGAKRAFRNANDGMMASQIENLGNKNTPSFLRGMGCLAQAIPILLGAGIMVKSGLESPAPENSIIPCATGLGMIVFGLLLPAFKKLFKK